MMLPCPDHRLLYNPVVLGFSYILTLEDNFQRILLRNNSRGSTDFSNDIYLPSISLRKLFKRPHPTITRVFPCCDWSGHPAGQWQFSEALYLSSYFFTKGQLRKKTLFRNALAQWSREHTRASIHGRKSQTWSDNGTMKERRHKPAIQRCITHQKDRTF